MRRAQLRLDMRPRIPSLVVGAAVTAGAIAIGNFVARRKARQRQLVQSEARNAPVYEALHAAKVAPDRCATGTATSGTQAR